MFGKRNLFLRNEHRILNIYPLDQKFRRNGSISHGLGDTNNFKFYHFCQKFKMATIFGKRKNFLKIEQSILDTVNDLFSAPTLVSAPYPYRVGQTFCRNRSISHGLGDTSNFKFYHSCQKLQNSKWPPFLERGNFFGIEQST